ncbi:MAG: hypothetical protein M3Z80_09255, partial [Apibacter sp.]
MNNIISYIKNYFELFKDSIKKIRIKYNILIRKFRNQNPQVFIYLASILIGIIGGISAVILKNLVSLTEELIYHNKNFNFNYWTIFFPT